jgi:hypothetical protein
MHGSHLAWCSLCHSSSTGLASYSLLAVYIILLYYHQLLIIVGADLYIPISSLERICMIAEPPFNNMEEREEGEVTRCLLRDR